MARPTSKRSDDLAIEKLRLDLERYKFSELHRTWRWLGTGLFATIALGMILLALVRMTEKPPWVQIIAALASLVVGPSILLWGIEKRLRRLETSEPLSPQKEIEPGDPDSMTPE